MFAKLVRAALVYTVKYLTLLFFKVEVRWITPRESIRWSEVRLVIGLNHTSLFEFLYLAAIPNRQLWYALDRFVMPVADITWNRPFVGHFFRWLIPHGVAITRKRDDSWAHFMQQIKQNSIIFIFPEGRMKRLDGLDKYGHPMSIKGGVAEILQKIDHGQVLIAYSGGLHHVQAPGQWRVHLFKTLHIAFEEINIQDYKRSLVQNSQADFRAAVIHDLEERMNKYCTFH